MGLRKYIKKLRRKEEEEEVIISDDWATQKPIEVEPVAEETTWPPYQKEKKVRLSLGKNKSRISKLMFVVYVVLSLGTVSANSSLLLLFVPTILIIMDYIRCLEKLDTQDSWAKPEETKIDFDNIASIE